MLYGRYSGYQADVVKDADTWSHPETKFALLPDPVKVSEEDTDILDLDTLDLGGVARNQVDPILSSLSIY